MVTKLCRGTWFTAISQNINIFSIHQGGCAVLMCGYATWKEHIDATISGVQAKGELFPKIFDCFS